MVNFSKFKNKKICVAVSGGVDSTTLLHYLKNLEKEHGFFLCAVHCEHGIRGEDSVDDMRFVQELCKKWSVPLFTFQENCPKKAKREKCSLETAARNFRKACFEQLIKENKAEVIATAHHVLDEAETVLFRIARGSALSGAAGMREESGYFIRPFLDWTKSQIFTYAKENGIAYRDDKTNFEQDATRNKLRLNVLPLLEQAVAGAQENIARFAKLAALDDDYLYEQSQKLIKKRGERITVAFCKVKPLFYRACLTAMKALGISKDYEQVHLDSVYALQENRRGAYVNLKQGVIAKRKENGVEFFVQIQSETFEKNAETAFDQKGFDGGRYLVKLQIDPPKTENEPWKTLRADLDKIPKDAVFRFRKDGDRIRKFGGTTKSLKKYFNEKKIPVEERAYLPLIASGERGEVYAVCGVEIADCVKVDESTKNAVYIILQKK